MRTEVVRRALTDARSGQVVLVSHCLLNQNVRYRGGATRPGAVDEVVAELQRAKVGIVQMPCPEQCAWGGVDKRYTTRVAYRRLAGQVVRDYVRSGQSVRAVVGVAGSPCGGVRTTLDLVGALDAIAGLWRSRRSQVRSAP